MNDAPRPGGGHPGADDLVRRRLLDGRRRRLRRREELAEALDILPDERVLDVACGSGNGAIAAARRTWGDSVGADYVPALLERGRERAAAERLEVEFVEADAQDLPFEDASFDVAMSIFGAMFAPDQQQDRVRAAAGREARRPDRHGELDPGRRRREMFMTIAKHAAAAARHHPPVLWGTEEQVRELFGDGISDAEGRDAASRASRSAPPSTTSTSSAPTSAPRRWPTNGSAGGREALADDLRAFLEEANTAGDRALVLEAEYLQMIATRA